MEVDEGGEFFGFLAGAVVDFHFEFAHVGHGDVAEEFGVGDAEDELADLPPFFDELDVIDFGVGKIDGGHLAFAAGEDISFHAPGELDVVAEEAKFSDQVFATQRINGRAVEVDVNRLGEDHGIAGILGLAWRLESAATELDVYLCSVALIEAAEFCEAGFFDESEGFVEVAGDLAGGVGVGGDGDGDVGFAGQFEKLGGRILFGARFVEAGGVEFDGRVSRDDGFDDGIVKAAEVAFGSVGEFFDEVWVSENVEETGAGHVGVFFPILRPDFLDVSFGPTAEPFGIVEVPLVVEVVDRADEIIPVVAAGEIDDPFVGFWKPIAFQACADGDFSVRVVAGSLDPVEVFR